MMLEAVFSAVLAGLEALLEDEDLEDEDEQRNKWKMKIVKDWTEEAMEINLIGKDWTEEEFEDEDEDEDNQQNKMKMSSDQFDDIEYQKAVYRDFDSARMFHKAIQPSIFNRVRENKSMNACFASEPSWKLESIFNRAQRKVEYGKDWTEEEFEDEDITKDIIDFKLSIDQPKIIRKQGTDMDIFWCIVDALAQECNHGKFSDVRRHEDQFFALIGDTANGQSISSNYCGHAGGFVNLSRTAPQTGGLAAMKSLGTECVNFSVTDSSVQNRAHRISSADAGGRLRPEVDTGFCSPLWVLDSGGAPPPWIYDTGASFSLTEDLCIPLPPRHHPHGRDHLRLHRPRAPSIQCLPRHHHAAHVWIYDTGASFSLTENLSLLHHRILPVLQHPPHAPQVHAHWIYDTGASFSLTENLSLLHRWQFGGQVPPHWIYDIGASFSLTENLSLLQPEPELHHQLPLPPVWIYDTGASFSLTGDLSLLPGVCSIGDCSPFLGLRRADPVSAANGQSVVSNKCGRASGTLNLSQTAPQTTGLISSSEPIAADNSSLLTPDTVPEQTWRVASAAPQHMTGYLNHLIDYTPASGDQVIDTPNMGRMAVHGRGSVNTANITLQDVLYVPCLDANLVSTGQLAQLGYMITLGPYGCRIYKDDEDMPLVGEAHYVDGYLLELDFLRVRPSTN